MAEDAKADLKSSVCPVPKVSVISVADNPHNLCKLVPTERVPVPKVSVVCARTK